MPSPQDYVLILGEQHCWLHQADFPSEAVTSYAVHVAISAEQAAEMAKQSAPCLVILVGNDHNWLQDQVRALRRYPQTAQTTIVALTASNDPNWQRQEETPDLDGFLVKPLTGEVLNSLVQSAIIKRSYQHPSIPCISWQTI